MSCMRSKSAETACNPSRSICSAGVEWDVIWAVALGALVMIAEKHKGFFSLEWDEVIKDS